MAVEAMALTVYGRKEDDNSDRHLAEYWPGAALCTLQPGYVSDRSSKTSRRRSHRSWPPRVECQVGDNLGDLVFGHAVVQRTNEMSP
jgi:hypothetical protein